MKKIIVIILVLVLVLVIVAIARRGAGKNSVLPFPNLGSLDFLKSDSQKIDNPQTDSWITVTPDKRYFMFEDGRNFIPLGVAISGDHINFDYLGNVTFNGQSYKFNDQTIEDLLKRIKNSGGNYLRIDIEGLGSFPPADTARLIDEGKIGMLENPVGTFNEEYAQKLDRLFELAKKHDIYLGLVLIAHTCELTVFDGWQERFNLYSYAKDQGGPASNFDEFFASRQARDLYKKRLASFIDRWGSSDRIFTLELFNEILNCGGTNPVVAADWTKELGNYLRDYQKQKYGKAHLVAISTDDFVPEHEFFYSSTGLDVLMDHLYGAQTMTWGNPLKLALNLNRDLPKMLERIKYSRPHLENERTLFWSYPISVQKEAEKYTAWSELASGSAGVGATWIRLDSYGPERSDEIVNNTNGAIGKILKDFKLADFNSRPKTLTSNNAKVLPMAVTDNNQAIVWFVHNNPVDYDIDIINLLRKGEFESPSIQFAIYAQWLKLYSSQGVKVLSEDYLEMMSNFVVKNMNVTKVQADQIVSDFMSDPLSIRGSGVKISKDLLPKILPLAKNLKDQLEKIESEKKVLANLYSGHPEVSSQITLNLDPGVYAFKWYDDNTGKLIKEENLETKNGTIIFQTPRFSKSIALTVTSI